MTGDRAARAEGWRWDIEVFSRPSHHRRPPRALGEIGQERHVTDATVKSYVCHLLVELHAHNRAHDVALGYQHGLLGLAPAA